MADLRKKLLAAGLISCVSSSFVLSNSQMAFAMEENVDSDKSSNTIYYDANSNMFLEDVDVENNKNNEKIKEDNIGENDSVGNNENNEKIKEDNIDENDGVGNNENNEKIKEDNIDENDGVENNENNEKIEKNNIDVEDFFSDVSCIQGGKYESGENFSDNFDEYEEFFGKPDLPRKDCEKQLNEFSLSDNNLKPNSTIISDEKQKSDEKKDLKIKLNNCDNSESKNEKNEDIILNFGNYNDVVIENNNNLNGLKINHNSSYNKGLKSPFIIDNNEGKNKALNKSQMYTSNIDRISQKILGENNNIKESNETSDKKNNFLPNKFILKCIVPGNWYSTGVYAIVLGATGLAAYCKYNNKVVLTVTRSTTSGGNDVANYQVQGYDPTSDIGNLTKMATGGAVFSSIAYNITNKTARNATLKTTKPVNKNDESAQEEKKNEGENNEEENSQEV